MRDILHNTPNPSPPPPPPLQSTLKKIVSLSLELQSIQAALASTRAVLCCCVPALSLTFSHCVTLTHRTHVLTGARANEGDDAYSSSDADARSNSSAAGGCGCVRVLCACCALCHLITDSALSPRSAGAALTAMSSKSKRKRQQHKRGTLRVEWCVVLCARVCVAVMICV
jgi:hypothetical protein